MAKSWDTAADWDAASSESGVVHESVANTDHDNAGNVWRGYPIANPLFSNNLVQFLPLHENSGSTAYDFSGGNNDGTVGSGVAQGEAGLLSGTSYKFSNNSGDYIEHPKGLLSSTSDTTWACWIQPIDNTVTDQRIHDARPDVGLIPNINRSGNGNWEVWDGSEHDSGVTATTGQWAFIVVTHDYSAGTVEMWENAARIMSFSSSLGPDASDRIGWSLNANTSASNRPVVANMAYLMLWDGRKLTSSEIQKLYDIYAMNGALTAGWK